MSKDKGFIINLHGDFDGSTTVVTELKEAYESGERLITIDIDSNGGYVAVLEDILEVMKFLRGRGCKINTHNSKKAYSCGAILLSQGDYRTCSLLADTMVHEVACGLEGKVTEMEKSIQELREFNERWFKIMLKRMKISRRTLEKRLNEVEERNWFFNSDTAKQIGIIDDITL